MEPDTPNNSTIWKPIPGYPSYLVSNKGAIFSRHKRKLGLLRQHIGNHGYRQVTLYPGKSGRLVHRLVAEAFVPNPENKPEVNHEDGCKTNNVATNLTWATEQENTDHGIRTGLIAVRGTDNAMAKLNPQKVREIRAKYVPRRYTVYDLASEYGVSTATISLILKRLRWGYVV